jgi:hypothetical protein
MLPGNSHSPDSVLARLDLSNAFNKECHGSILLAVQDQVSWINYFRQLAYVQLSLLVFSDFTLLSPDSFMDGVILGSPEQIAPQNM